MDGQPPKSIEYPLFRIVFSQTLITDSVSVLKAFLKLVIEYHLDLELIFPHRKITYVLDYNC